MGNEQKKTSAALVMGGVEVKPGDRIGNYIFVRQVGSGGMAQVLLARDPSGEMVALKVLRKSRFKNGLARFAREFRALSRVNHPNVIKVLAYGDLHGHPYFAMEYVEGPDLHTQIRGFRTWAPKRRFKRAEEVLVDICRALAAIHKRGLVHRDLKPSNILVAKGNGTCKLTDFGIVKDLDPSADPQASTTLVGTWAYASPEQITGNAVDHRSDLYSLGVILFAMLTSKRPFVANDMAGYLALHRDRAAPEPAVVNPAIPKHLNEITVRLLQKAPRDRYQSAQEILYRLEAEEQEHQPNFASGWHPPLTGRDLESEVISNSVASLTDRRGGVLIIEGEDGVGKSRMLDFAADRTRSLGITTYRVEFASKCPVFSRVLPMAQAMEKDLGKDVPQALKTAIESFSQGINLGINSRYALYDGLSDAMRLLMESGPLMLALDDLHRARPRELDLVSFLIRSLVEPTTHPLLIMGAIRPRANQQADALCNGDSLQITPRELTIGALCESEVVKIVKVLAGESEQATLLGHRIHAETEGNAYFVTEFLRSLLTRGVIVEKNGKGHLTLESEQLATEHLEIPPGVRQLMQSRLQAVRECDRPLLEALVIGARDVDIDVIIDLLDEDEEDILDSLDDLIAKGIVRERRINEVLHYSVTHQKFSDVVYRDLDPTNRADLHRKMAATLELRHASNPSALEVVGEHYRKAGDAGRAYRYLVAASKKNLDRSLVHEAWGLAETASAIEQSAKAEMRPEVYAESRLDHLVVRASVHHVHGEWSRAAISFEAAALRAKESGKRQLVCDLELQQAASFRRSGHIEKARILAERSLETSRSLQYRKGIATSLHTMATLAWTAGQISECERLSNEGLAVATGENLALQRAELLSSLTAALATRGNLAPATKGLAEAEGIFRDLRQKRMRCLALSNAAELLTWQGAPLKARQRAHVALQLAGEIEHKLGIIWASKTAALAALDLGMYEDAQRGLEKSLEMVIALKADEDALAVVTPLVNLHTLIDEPTKAIALGRSVFESETNLDPERHRPLLAAYLSIAYGMLEDSVEATKFAKLATEALPSLPIPRKNEVRLALATTWFIAGQPIAAKRETRHALQTADSRGFRLRSIEARILMTRLTEGTESTTHRAVAMELLNEFSSELPVNIRTQFEQRSSVQWLKKSN